MRRIHGLPHIYIRVYCSHATLKNLALYPSGPGARLLLILKRAFRISSLVTDLMSFYYCLSMRTAPSGAVVLSSAVQPTATPRNSSTTSVKLVVCSPEALMMAINVLHLLFHLTRSWKNFVQWSLCLRYSHLARCW